MKHKMVIAILTLSLLAAGCRAYISHPKFGATPRKERLKSIQASPNYRDGCFQNISVTPQLTENFLKAAFQPFSRQRKPKGEIPVVKTDLNALSLQDDLLVWFGHSSYFFQAEGRRFLVDPVLSRAASPAPFVNTAFKGADAFDPEDIPDIDYLIITHDHWDHLDYPTVKALRPRTGKVICPLGVGAHFERWGYDESNVVEMDWEDSLELDSCFAIHCFPARHFSGRGFKAKQSLWASFLLKSETLTLYIGGDGGYDTHFARIGERFGSIDFALLENGQYNSAWRYIHLQPEETLQAAKDLHAKNVIPVHNSKFSMSNHDWNEPLQRLSELSDADAGFRLLTPKTGEIVLLRDTTQTFARWWPDV
ncbi:MAG: MBL fold metallo-hydrolase [Tannerellaceae bacterium]|jgi:L-ascorbate metabolism protein UlaG (beta-lactamase superfamily)|nr:MBL fold metallo-hydrolase [Tannerellaceae bacterium]